MFKESNKSVASANNICSAMEREPISKNRVSPKNVRSRRNFLSILTASLFLTMCCFITSCEKEDNSDIDNTAKTNTLKGTIWACQGADNQGEFATIIKFTSDTDGTLLFEENFTIKLSSAITYIYKKPDIDIKVYGTLFYTGAVNDNEMRLIHDGRETIFIKEQ
ncbi:MAG: hypothetical protein LBT04_05580 [Prevotellaceae bacterium]|jgi:hypothetical protein|nr:hypothetical protein [Prevotellaceae bacterium]